MPSTNNNSKFQIDEVASFIGNIFMMLACFVLILPVFIKNIHVGYQYIIICCVLQVISIVCGILNIIKSKAAVHILPILAINDILIYAVLFAGNIFSKVHCSNLYDVLYLFPIYKFIDSPGFIAILVITAIALIASLFYSLRRINIAFSVVFSLEGVVLSLFYIWGDAFKADYGRNVLGLTLMLTLIWIFICTYCNAAVPDNSFKTSVLSVVFSVATFLFNCYMANNNSSILNSFFNIPADLTGDVAQKIYPWWLVILLAVITVAAYLAIGFFVEVIYEDEIASYVDAKFLWGFTVIVFVSKIILANYFAYSFVLYIALLLAVFLELKNDVRKSGNGKFSGLNEHLFSIVKLVYFIICALIVVKIAKNMLYLTFPVALAIMIMIFKILRNLADILLNENEVTSIIDGLPKAYNRTIIILAVALSASLAFHYGLSVGTFLFLGVVLAAALGVLMCLKKRLPDNIELPELKTVKWCLTGFVVIVCIVLTSSTGADVKMDYNKAIQTTTINVTTGDSTIEKVVYEWDNGIVYNVYNEIAGIPTTDDSIEHCRNNYNNTSGMELTLPVKGECLTVRVTDSNGVVTTKTFWYPLWFDTTVTI